MSASFTMMLLRKAENYEKEGKKSNPRKHRKKKNCQQLERKLN